jgi:hypothetical protein
MIKINDDIINVQSPSLICLDECKKVKILASNNLSVKTIHFDPLFINRNMSIDTIRSSEYHDLAERHCYFQLLPFLEHNDKYKSVLFLNDFMSTSFYKASDLCQEQLEVQSDNY